MKNDLIKILEDNGIRCESPVEYVSFKNIKCTLKKIRDLLIIHENIDIENLDERYYIAHVDVEKNFVSVVVKLNADEIEVLANAKEGLIKRNFAKKAIEKIRRMLDYEA